jgi:hypothetical protein
LRRAGEHSFVRRLGSYECLLTTILFLAVFLTCGLTPMQSDTWWQLRAGHDMLASGRVLLTDTYSHTANGVYWSNHEWGAEVIFYALYSVGGFGLLTIFCATLISVGWMFSWTMREGLARPAFILFLCALVASSGWWEPRPHAFSLLFIPMMLFLLQRSRDTWLPLVFFIWAQCHGGVLLGLALLTVGMAARVLVDRRTWPRAVVVLLACAAAMTATPLGIHFWTEIPRSLSRINLYTLDEWMRPTFTEGVLIPFWVIAAVYVAALAREGRRLRQVAFEDAALHACAVVLLIGALSAVRNVGPFLMLACPALTRLRLIKSSVATSDNRSERTLPNLVIQGVALASVGLILMMAYRDNWPRLKRNPVPEAAWSALEECPGNLYNRYDEGGLLIWFAPERKVFLDGRQDPFSSTAVLEHIEMETGKRDYRETFERHDIRCAFLPPVSPVASQLATSGWKPVYQSPQWVVLKRP